MFAAPPLLIKVLSVIPRPRLLSYGASLFGAPALLMLVFGDQLPWKTPLQALSRAARVVGWTAGQDLADTAHSWLLDPARANGIAAFGGLLAGATLAVNHLRIDGRRPTYAMPVALCFVALLVELGQTHTAWTALLVGTICSALPHLDGGIRALASAMVVTVADLCVTALYLPGVVIGLLWTHPRTAAVDQPSTPSLPTPAAAIRRQVATARIGSEAALD